MHSLLGASCITRESSDGFLCEETVLDVEKSELSKSLAERVDIPAALDDAVNRIPPASAEEEGKPNAAVTKRLKKKGRKNKDGKVTVFLPLKIL